MMSPAPEWKAYLEKFWKAFEGYSMADDYGGNIYITGGNVPPGMTVIVTPDYDKDGTLIGLYTDEEFDNAEGPTVPYVNVPGSDQIHYPDKYIPLTLKTMTEMIDAFRARKAASLTGD